MVVPCLIGGIRGSGFGIRRGPNPQSRIPNPVLSRLPLAELVDHFVDRAHHVEILFWDFVVLALDDLLEPADRVGDGDVLAFEPGELLRDEERLRQELLNLARTRYG